MIPPDVQEFTTDDPMYHGSPGVPLECGVIFTNIHRQEYIEKGLGKIISDICSDPSGHCFADVLEKKFPPKFRYSLTSKQVIHLKQLIFPVVRIETPERESDFPYEKRKNRLNGLDHLQEALARRFVRGGQPDGEDGAADFCNTVFSRFFSARKRPWRQGKKARRSVLLRAADTVGRPL